MKLFYSTTSPYARKTRAVLREKGMLGQVEEVLVNPWSEDDADVAELRAINPLGKVPALIGPAGESYFDSRVICAFLDAQSGNRPLIPQGGEERFRVLRAEALADGVLDAAVNIVIEGRRPAEKQSDAMLERCAAGITRSLQAMSEALPYLPKDITLGHIAFAVALGYLDFRVAHLRWRERHVGLSQWYEELSARPSLSETAPPKA